MVTKLTLRLPDDVAARLRAKTAKEGTSLNDAVVRAVRRDLGDEPEDEWWRTLGDLLERPPLAKFDPEALKRFHALLPKTDTSIDDTLNWLRQDRDL
jgi:hypothetical protein